MGLFDFFKEKDNGKARRGPMPGERELPERRAFEKPADSHPMQMRRPRSFADVEEIIDRLKDKLSVIVYLNDLSTATAERVTDILSGAIYALGGGMAQIEKDIYLFTPDGVNAD